MLLQYRQQRMQLAIRVLQLAACFLRCNARRGMHVGCLNGLTSGGTRITYRLLTTALE